MNECVNFKDKPLPSFKKYSRKSCDKANFFTHNRQEGTNKMNVAEAKEIMRQYIEGQLEMYKDVLGEEEDFDSSTLSGVTVQDLEEAYKVIKITLL